MALVGRPVFYAKGPFELTGDFLSHTNGDIGSSSQKWGNGFFSGKVTGYNAEFYSFAGETGDFGAISVDEFYPVGQPDLGHSNQRWNDLYLTGDVFADQVQTREVSTTNISANSGQFNILNITGQFFPPRLTFDQRTGIWSGVLTPESTPYDGMMIFQMTSGQKLMIVQSGVWKDVSLV